MPEHLASRRVLLTAPCAAAVAAGLGACSTYGGSSAPEPAPPANPPATGQPPPSSPSGGGEAPPPAGPPPLATLASIPVGGGRIFGDQKVVVTQPEAGTVKAFSTTCTHAGCEVTAVADGTINCPCHGSKFAIADGSVTDGPAPRPLPAVGVQVDGDAIRLT
ncbi:Rieske (2Fe-2S) protein [Phytohabitans sp. LJ34]|uniref:Rieske (2Fe-2S) protein n=1 Tax=Phytohabitans sp. LJ34 TaxID=3452217 RepID=UPI003F8A78DF